MTATLVIAIAAMLSYPAAAGEAPYPNRPIRLIVGQAAGGATDIVIRAFATRLADALGGTIVVDNRPGAGGAIGAAIVANAAPDGYTLLAGTNGPLAISPHVMRVQYDVQRDFIPVALFSEVPFAVVVHPSVQAKTLRELIALAKSQPGKLHFASSGQGGTPHLCLELLKHLTGIDIVHVPFRGGAPAQIDLMAGRVQMYCAGFPSLAPNIRAGKIRALAVASKKRSSVMPQVPTAAEAGLPNFEVTAWNGILVPAKTPEAIVRRLHDAAAVVVKSPEFQAYLQKSGAEPLLLGRTEFGKYIREESQLWARVVKAAGITNQ
ncbi:MAG TPA: tripartite tricarboxylate transporter substrate binding protein [Burkholderiales bacterium]|nr:tripartite tricarboxylate transporter substrate binding protein [Burkholderiales bacterium]